jgi:hypothetical protein
MQHSGPNNPCPCCSRTKGDYCRWDDQRILCYVGQTCGPPADLQVGQTIQIDGQNWALVKTDCGFAGNSFLFVVDDPSTALQHDQFEQDAELAATALRRIEDLSEFTTLPPAAIQEALGLCSGAQVLLIDLLVRCRKMRRQSPDIGAIATQLQEGLRAVRYQGQNLQRFWFDLLLDPAGCRGRQLAQQLREEVQA